MKKIFKCACGQLKPYRRALVCGKCYAQNPPVNTTRDSLRLRYKDGKEAPAVKAETPEILEVVTNAA